MRRSIAIVGVCTALFALGSSAVNTASPPAAPAAAAEQRALVDKYCVGCHNERTKTADLMLDKARIDQLNESPETWEKVVKKLRTGAMPPVGSPRPDAATLDGFVSWLES